MFIITIIWAGEFVALFLFWLQAAELRKDKKKEVKTTNHLFFFGFGSIAFSASMLSFLAKAGEAKAKQSQ